MPITPSFTKLQRAILSSSIWLQDTETRIVWITLLALCDRDGVARCSPLGLAHQARVDAKDCERALGILMAPDADSRDGGDGRRVERVEGGFSVINYPRVMAEGARQERTDYMREKQREHRAKKAAQKDGSKIVRTKHVPVDKPPTFTRANAALVGDEVIRDETANEELRANGHGGEI